MSHVQPPLSSIYMYSHKKQILITPHCHMHQYLHGLVQVGHALSLARSRAQYSDSREVHTCKYKRRGRV